MSENNSRGSGTQPQNQPQNGAVVNFDLNRKRKSEGAQPQSATAKVAQPQPQTANQIEAASYHLTENGLVKLNCPYCGSLFRDDNRKAAFSEVAWRNAPEELECLNCGQVFLNVVHLLSAEELQPQTQPQTANGQAQNEAQPQSDGNYDFEELLRQAQGKPGRFAKPPREAAENLGEWASWGWGIASKPLGLLFDLMDNANPNDDPNDQGEYMSRPKYWMYVFGGAMVFGWSAFTTQTVMPHIFPFLDAAAQTVEKEKQDLFKNGLTIMLRALVASAIFGATLSFIETMIFDGNKSKAKKTIILLAFLVDWVINTIGWADMFGHNKYFEWNPLAPIFRDKNGYMEWGSFICEFAAIMTAALPEIMWEKARRAKRWAKAHRQGQQRGGESGPQQGQGSGRGVMIRDKQGQLRWVSEEQLKKLAKAQQKRRRAATGGR
jgi:hypothetical protein